MKSIRYIQSTLIALMVLATTSCTDDILPLVGGEEMVVTFRPTISNTMTRAIGDGTKINELVVGVYSGENLIFKKEMKWNEAKDHGVNLTLIEGRTYNILFWAQDSVNSAYKVKDIGITVDYADYLEGGFAKMEELDAFCATASLTVGSQKIENKGNISLSRPLAQVNFADNTTSPTQGAHKAVVTFTQVPKAFNPFKRTVTKSEATCTFTFTDFPTEPLMVDGTTYYYVTDNYFFAPASIGATLDLQNADGTSIKTVELADGAIALEANKKTNVLGSIVQKPETWSVWDGVTTTEPDLDDSKYIIDEASDIAWLADNGATLAVGSTFLQTKDIDMASKAITSIKLPTGSTYDGGGKTIKNFANSLFGDAISLTVKDLAVENIVASGSTHIGTLVNTLQGSSSFANVSVLNSTVTTTNGAAGGMVGYIVRTSKDRTETLSVSFSGCKLNGVSVSGSASEGKFVGLLSGYDNQESLSFDTACEATTTVTVTDYTSTYISDNNSAWAGDVDAKYDGWLGAENYRRAKVTFGGIRLAPRWDGKTVTAKADLLLYNGESNKYEVHSPFDLAGVRNATAAPAALYLMENVDMHGQGTDGKFFVHSNFTKSASNSADDNKFNAFSSIALLEGNNKSIYNLALNANGSDRYAFILSGNNGDIHRNTSFHNCCTVVPHVVKDNEDKSYGATVVLSISGATYTMENIHAYGCKVFALQKTGIIAGRVTSLTMATIKDCTVNNCYIENYNCKDHAEDFGGITTFYTPGEVGSFIGFVENFATISNCHVKGTTIHAFGQNNKWILITVYGRHVGQFIGDIRTSDGEKDKITLTNCTVDSNTKCTQRWDKHGKCNMIGCVYYISMLDTKGTVTLDGKSIF